MDIHIACPGCDKHFRVASQHAGQKVKCPNCELLFLVPAPEPEKPMHRPLPPSGHAPAAPASAPGPNVPAPSSYPQQASGGAYQQPGYGAQSSGYSSQAPAYGSRSGAPPKPPNVNTAGVLMLIGGIFSLMAFLGLAATCWCLFWPPLYLQIVTGILCIVKGSELMGDYGYQKPPPTAHAVMMILNILNMDVMNLTLGIICLVMLNDPQSRAYFRG